MLICARHIFTITALSLAGFTLGGCGTINEKLSAGMGDYIPQWAGGLPADAPPRPGTAQYEEYMKERERKRLMPAAEPDETTQSTSPGQSASSSGQPKSVSGQSKSASGPGPVH
jgi:hypothetical protein